MKMKIKYQLLITSLIMHLLLYNEANSQPSQPSEQQKILSQQLKSINNISPLRIKGANFFNNDGKIIRFWGVNLTSFYPTHTVAEKTAENLADLGVNMVRPHHMMRPSRDWNPQMQSGALVNYQHNSREFDSNALDKFDYLNAALRNKGIYLAFSLRWSRSYHEGDVDILTTTDDDAKAWINAWQEIKSWHWRKQHDVVKSLSLIDERFIAIDIEFASKLLQHVNPYTNLSYAQDPQVATIEVINEYSAEYTFICNNKFPQYFHDKLQNQWDTFARDKGIPTSDFYTPQTHTHRMLRLDFLIALDEARMQRMTKLSRDLGFKGAITYSNLFRGENHLALHDRLADYMEDHVYANPFIVDNREDLFHAKSKTLLKDKPYIVSEFNITENRSEGDKYKNIRTMLTASTVAYASFHNWSGIVWFSWQHGTNKIAEDGWSVTPSRNKSIGNMVSDDMQLDHFKTASVIYRNGYVQSSQPKIVYVDAPYKYSDYHSLMNGKYQFNKGLHNIHSIRKTFSPSEKTHNGAEWTKLIPQNPLISDTKEIVKDIERKQLTVNAEKTEIFSGFFDDSPITGLTYISSATSSGFATIMLTANDDKKLVDSKNLLISKTYFDADNDESNQLILNLKTTKSDSHWRMKITRPFDVDNNIFTLSANSNGELTLPQSRWYEAEITQIEPPNVASITKIEEQ